MALRIVLALALVFFALAVPFGSSGAESTGHEPTATAPSTPAASPEPTWLGAQLVGLDSDPARSAEAQDVIARFADVGLELPTVTIEFHDSTTPCNGHDGFIRYVEPAPVISICSDLAYVVPHELAHAWVDANLSDAAKVDYVERWDLASWDGANDDWNDRGTEDAAFVIQQNISATSPRMTRTWQERAEAFELLTGVESPLSSGAAA